METQAQPSPPRVVVSHVETRQAVAIVDIEMPFGSMVRFMIKAAFAAIPAAIAIGAISGIIAAVVLAALGGLGAAVGHR